MTLPALFAFLHHVAAFTLVAALAVEFVLIREEITLLAARSRRSSWASRRERMRARSAASARCFTGSWQLSWC